MATAWLECLRMLKYHHHYFILMLSNKIILTTKWFWHTSVRCTSSAPPSGLTLEIWRNGSDFPIKSCGRYKRKSWILPRPPGCKILVRHLIVSFRNPIDLFPFLVVKKSQFSVCWWSRKQQKLIRHYLNDQFSWIQLQYLIIQICGPKCQVNNFISSF